MNDESNKLDSHNRGGVQTAFARTYFESFLFFCFVFGESHLA